MSRSPELSMEDDFIRLIENHEQAGRSVSAKCSAQQQLSARLRGLRKEFLYRL